LSGVNQVTLEMEDTVFEAGCDDALLGMQNGSVFLDFHRDAASPIEAISSAIADISKAGYEVERIEPDDSVSAAEIARRTKRSRTSIMQLRRGSRGPGGFPAPVACVRQKTPVWSWWMVADWLAKQNLIEESQEVEYARTIAWINAAIGVTQIRLAATKSNVESLVKLISPRKQQAWQVQIVRGSTAKKAGRKARSV
jgi:hypothetical protein